MPDLRDTPTTARGGEAPADRIAAAKAALGDGAPNDYVIAPAEHAGRYREAAPGLAAVLDGSGVRVVAERFETLDSRALERQAAFQAASRRAAVAVFWAGVAAALVLVAGTLANVLPEGIRNGLMIVATAGAVVTGALAAMWIRQIKEGHLLEGWMTARAEAETARLEYFERITGAGDADPSLLLEYFRRYQLDVQRAYYRARADDHRRDADRALSRSSIGLAGAAVASGLAGVLGVIDPAWAALAGLGLVAQAWAARVVNDEATAQSRRNAERYDRTHLALDRLYERLDDVRAAAAGGERDVLGEYVEAVHEQLSLEHRQWLEETDAAGKAVTRLEALLADYRARAGAGPSDAGSAE